MDAFLSPDSIQLIFFQLTCAHGRARMTSVVYNREIIERLRNNHRADFLWMFLSITGASPSCFASILMQHKVISLVWP